MTDVYSLALCKVRGIGPAIAKKLMDVYPSAQALFEETPANLQQLFKGKEKTIEDIISRKMFPRCNEELEFMDKNNIRCYFIKDEDYPYRLKEIDSPPTCLFVKGNGNLDTPRTVSIIGSRHASDYGKWVTASIVHELKAYNACIISGLAYGIDSAAHICALNEGMSTFGVFGHGLDKVYPVQNYNLAQSMLAQGGLVSEFFSLTPANAYNFPQRNRIIAALSDLCIVVEGGIKSGSMITPRYAREFDREVLAVPGRIGDAYSEGCNNLIASNVAGLLSDITAIGSVMNWTNSPKTDFTKPQKVVQTEKAPERIEKKLPEMTEQEKIIYDFIRQTKKAGIDDLLTQCRLDFASVSICLMNLELKGCIAALPGKRYECLI